MGNLKNFYNRVSGDNRIYTAEDIGAMSGKEFSEHEEAIDYQMGNLGIPRNYDLAGNPDVVFVQGYTRRDGTEVKSYYRSKHGRASTLPNAPEQNGMYRFPYSDIGSTSQASSHHKLDDVIKKFYKEEGLIYTPGAYQEVNVDNAYNILTKEPVHLDSSTPYKIDISHNEYIRPAKNSRYTEIKNPDNSLIPSVDFSQLEKTNFLAAFNADQNKARPDAREMMNISLSGFKNLPPHPGFNVLQPDAVDFVNETLNIKNSAGLSIPKDWHGIIYDKDSGFSRRLSNSPELQKQVLENYNQHTGVFDKKQIVINFTQDKNLNYSIGHGTIMNPRIDENGNFSAILFDKYDYEWHSKRDIPNRTTRLLNNGAYVLQSASQIKNYYVIIPIRFKVRK